jgi:Zinc carboxypeptidase
MRILAFLICTLFFPAFVFAQNTTLEYYLPSMPYNSKIPTPSSWLGYNVGDWHATHDQLLGYMRALDAVSDRITLQEYGRSHENRPLICLTISDPSNLAHLDEIKSQRQKWADPYNSDNIDPKKLPAVQYMGYSIHGNEASGCNAALLVAYYLAAGEGPEVTNLLKNTVFLFDPCFNPDGMQRFSSWVNSHKSHTISTDPSGDEYNEPWPRGRTNHYGFDLNRDWLVMQQPESKGRVAIFQDWKPNVLTDHHEMGSNSTFFFQPGVPSRANPITPEKNQELTAKIATYHAKLLSANKVLFYTGESFDDFYYGKGSTYPDAQGSIGILFEQASSRGTAQDTENGVLTFPYSIKNQVMASLSTMQAVGDMRLELNQYLRDFYKSALVEARKSDVKGYVFADGTLPARLFLELLGNHHINVQNLTDNLTLGTQTFQSGKAFFIPTEQAQYRLVRAIFERTTTFKDSIFYDISAWTLPDAFGLEWSPVTTKSFKTSSDAPTLSLVSLRPPSLVGVEVPYAYTIQPEDYDVPKVLYALLQAGVRVRVAMEPFEADGYPYRQGTLVIAADRQTIGLTALTNMMGGFAQSGVAVGIIQNGLTASGPDLGSSHFQVVRLPKIVMLTGEGVNIADAGEIWHQLDTRYGMPLTMTETDRFSTLNLTKYNVLVLPDGNYKSLPIEKVKQFAQDGGTIIATGKAIIWLKNSGIAPVELRKRADDSLQQRPYQNIEEDKGAFAMPGAIFEAKMDLTHPLCFGYSKQHLPVFMGDTLFMKPGKNPYSTPVTLTDKPLLAGYVHPKIAPMAPNSVATIVYGIGKGRAICFPIDPNFRAFWYGTNRLFANAVFFGNLINGDSTEK